MHELVVEIPYKDFPHVMEENIVSFGCGDGLQREVHCKLDSELIDWFFETGTKPPVFVSKHVIQETRTMHPFFQENMLKFWFADHRDAISFKLAWG
jgi:hypothetical protein